MAYANRSEYSSILVESFISNASGHRDPVQIRPASGQVFPQHLLVECRRDLRNAFPPGTTFRLYVRRKQKLDGKPHLYCPYRWSYDVVKIASR